MANASITSDSAAKTNTDDPPPCILVVDDETTITEEIVDWLELRDIACHTAPGAQQALEILARNPAITVLLTDINMPGMNGLSLATQAQAIRSEAHAMEVVVLTGQATSTTAQDAQSAGVLDFIVKPASFGKLETVLERAHSAAACRRRRFHEAERLLAELRARIRALEATAPPHDNVDSADQEDRIDFLAAACHLVLTTLHQLPGTSDLTGLDPTHLPPEALRDYARGLLLSGGTPDEQTRILLDLAETRISGGRPQATSQDLPWLLGELADSYRACARLRNQTISLDCPPRLRLFTDGERLGQIVRHLLAGALHAAASPAVIVLAARAVRAEIHIYVAAAPDISAAAALAARLGGPLTSSGISHSPVTGQTIGCGVAALLAAQIGGRLITRAGPDGRIATLIMPAALAPL